MVDPTELTALEEPAPVGQSIAEPEMIQIPVGATMAEIEREVIMRSLIANSGNKTATADMLGISRRSIYNKLAEYTKKGLIIPKFPKPCPKCGSDVKGTEIAGEGK
jgi:DNA-binding NtrC family response regulator